MLTAEIAFQLVNLTAVLFWGLMILAPRWKVTRCAMSSMLAPVLFAILYSFLVTKHLATLLPILLRPDLEQVTKLLSAPETALLAWIHFIAFDLFVGRWEYLDAQSKGVKHYLLAPALILTLFLGPLGLLVYLTLRGQATTRNP